ncbi:RNA-binding domain-containing protein [Lentinula lateritia]|uniref:RNA-binding domain-containing protein n=1 Tax=Lentinula aff. lateritia TaxID=2804960 RepID=A0ACC1U822_9AGAR|nr:RNA-binding domain-containing protein [Lentinula aff. lateritia]KAJ3848958.1 RNA-binding domain-containing protein [Lentinula lateritia]
MAPLKPSNSSRLGKVTKRKLTESSASKPAKATKKLRVNPQLSFDPQNQYSNSEGDAEGKNDEDEQSGEEEEEEGMLHGLSTDEDDSSDDEEIDGPPVDITKLPTIAKDDATVQKRLERAKRQPAVDRGVLYLGHLPHGFYEDQLKGYFSQFGNVTRLRISRNKKTGRSKHYAFLEFDSSSVAEIVAETMNNYLLMGHILQCKVIPKDEIHPELWVGANRKWRVVPMHRVARVKHNKLRTLEEQAKATKRLLRRQNDKKSKLEKLGISYNFDAVAYVCTTHLPIFDTVSD